MADGLNNARAMRIAEVMNDYSLIQSRIVDLRQYLPTGNGLEVGYAVLRQCLADARALLEIPFDGGKFSNPPSSGEATRKQLQRQMSFPCRSNIYTDPIQDLA